MPADARPTVNFGTRMGRNSPDARRAAADLKAGQKRAEAEERANAYRRAMSKRKPSQEGYAARTRRKRLNPAPVGIGPAANMYQYTVE